MQVTVGGKGPRIENALGTLVGLQLVSTWTAAATRTFEFSPAGKPDGDPAFSLMIECAWRIETGTDILVGSEDYSLDAREIGENFENRQDELLFRLLGGNEPGGLTNVGLGLVVETVVADPWGGFQLSLSGGYRLVVFPTGSDQIQWMLKRCGVKRGSIKLYKAQIIDKLSENVG